MSKIVKDARSFVGYEYKEIFAEQDKASLYLDGYSNFGWISDGNIQPSRILGKVSIKLKRDRKILNKAELTRLQRHFDSCMNEIDKMEISKTQSATIWAISVGIVGTAFMTGSVFAVTAAVPLIALCVVLGIPGCIGWVLPYFVFKRQMQKRVDKITPLIEQKYDEIYEICEKGNRLLG